METSYVLLLIVGVIVVLVSFFFGEIDSDHDGFHLLSPLSIAAGLVASGGVGFASTGLSDVLSLLLAVGAFFAAYTAILTLKKYIRRQESNSHAGLASYIGIKAKVTGVYDGRYEINFIDRDGARVTKLVLSSHAYSLSKGDEVVIHSIENGELFVAPYDA